MKEADADWLKTALAYAIARSNEVSSRESNVTSASLPGRAADPEAEVHIRRRAAVYNRPTRNNP